MPQANKLISGRKSPATTLTAIGLFITGPTALALDVTPAIAHVAAAQAYEVPAGSVADGLNLLADASGAQLVYDAALTRHVKSRGVTRAQTLEQALRELLTGTGLSYEIDPSGRSVAIVLAQNNSATASDASGATPLPTIDIGPEGGGASAGRGTGGQAQGYGDRKTGYTAVSAPATLKTDAPLMQTPFSVGVVTRQTMDDQQAINVGEAVLSNVSGLTPVPTQLETLKIRGFLAQNSVYKNGLQEYQLRNFSTANLQSVEVLKGPAAMLFGRSEPGGILNLVVKRPLETPYYSIEQQVKSYSGTRTTVDATGPLTEDKSVLYRFNGEFYRTDSYRNFVTGRNLFLAPTITLHPIEQFRMNIDFEYQNKTWVDDYQLLPAVGDHPANIPASRYLSAPYLTTMLPDHFEKKRIAYDWTYDITPEWSLTNRLSYTNLSLRNGNATGAAFNQITGVLSRNFVYFPGNTDKDLATNLDLKGKFATGPLEHSVLVGFDYFNTYRGMQSQNIVPISPINIYAPVYWRSENPYRLTYGHSGQKWTGVYAQDTISFLDDSVHVLLGGRYDWAEVSASGFKPTYLEGLGSYRTDYKKAFSPRVGVVYQPQPWLSFYGSFSQSFGANNTTNYNLPLPPQRGEQFEGGVKAEFLDKRLTVTMAYFDITKTNIPTPDPRNPTYTTLIGKARSQGFEFDVKGRIDDNWSIIANYTHDDVRTLEGSQASPIAVYNGQLAAPGKVLASSPRNYGNLWLKYEADGELRGLSLGGGLTVTGSALGDNANSFILPGYALLNGMIGYSTKIEGYNVTAQLNVKNLTNANYYPGSLDRTFIMTGAPREFLGSLRVEF